MPAGQHDDFVIQFVLLEFLDHLLGKFRREPHVALCGVARPHLGAEVRLFPACRKESRFVLSIKAEPVSTKLGTGA